MLELDGVSLVRDGQTFIAPTSLKLERGSLNVLLGPTLAGKTSLMRLMAGLDRPTAGRIIYDGVDVTGVAVRARSVAMVYQQFINYPGLSVRENIASPLRVRKEGRERIEEAVARAAKLLKLEPYLDRRPLELSGGQQQRVALARALVKGAGLVLLDEPLANLDYKLREELRAELPRLFADSGAVLVYATTEPTEALLLGGKTATMSEGRITQFGEASNVYRHPVDLLTARTYSDPPLNVLETDGRARGFRAHHLRVGEAGAGEQGFTATVTSTEITGSETYVHIAVEDHAWVMLLSGVHHFANGVQIYVCVREADMMHFGSDGRAQAPEMVGA